MKTRTILIAGVALIVGCAPEPADEPIAKETRTLMAAPSGPSGAGVVTAPEAAVVPARTPAVAAPVVEAAPAAEAAAEVPKIEAPAVAAEADAPAETALPPTIPAEHAEPDPVPSTAPADHPAYAVAGQKPAPNRSERILGIEPVPEPAADAPPLELAAGGDIPEMDPDAPVPNAAGCNGGLRGLSAEFPWGRNPKGGLWEGTGHPDPGPLRTISDAQMLALAADTASDTIDREHALVSIGRRHVPGAIAAFRDSLELSQPRPIREMALSGLIEHGGKPALDLMWKVLQDDPSSQLRGMAIWAIALYGPDEATKAIMKGLEDPTYDVQGMAILAVWAIKDRPQQAFPILIAASKAEHQRLWQEGHNVLSRMPYPEAGKVLADIARNSMGEKRNSAVLYYRMWRNKFPDLCD